MNKILTILVPSYNMEAYLGKCLDSLIVKNTDGVAADDLMQTLEVLVINDGSKDNTSSIGHSYQDKFPKTFRVIDKENGHYGSCVNRGLKEAQGTFIRVLDADDYVDNAKFKRFVELLLSFSPNNLPEAVMTDYDYVNEKGIVTKKMRFDILPQNKFFSFKSIEHFGNLCFQNHNLTYRTDIPRSIGYHQTEGMLYTDIEWYILPMTHVEKVFYYPESIVQYLVGREGQSISREIKWKNFSSMLKVILGVLEKLKILERDSTNGGMNFARIRILQLIRNHYCHVICNGFDDKECRNNLKDFDLIFKDKFPVYYEKLVDMSIIQWRFFSFSYIREWRKHYTSITWRFALYWFLVWAGNIGHRLKKLFGSN